MILANIKFAPRDKENTFLVRHGIYEHLSFYGVEDVYEDAVSQCDHFEGMEDFDDAE